MEPTNSNAQQQHPYGFPFEPYPIQVQLMDAIYESAEQGKIALLESPTGTGKSLSAICAALSWLQANERRQQEQREQGIQLLLTTIKDASIDPDWLNVHTKKMEAEERLEELREEQAKQQKIEQKLEKARQGQRTLRERWKCTTRVANNKKRRRQSSGGDGNDGNYGEGEAESGKLLDREKADDDSDLIPSDNETEGGEQQRFNRFDFQFDDEEEEEKKKAAEEAEEKPQCLKLIYASRTHSQLEQFAKELERTGFRPRVLTLGSRQQLCVNDAVRRLGQSGLVNDRCNELLNQKKKKNTKAAADKRTKTQEDNFGGGTKGGGNKCGCPFARSDAIEDLAEAILTANDVDDDGGANGISTVVEQGRRRQACAYFASKAALGLSQLVLVPYNILLHPGTRKAWQLELRGNVVLVDEAHNLLQTLASIHSVELSGAQLQSCCQCLHDYLDRFRSRLSGRNLRNVRQLHQLTVSLQRFLASSAAVDPTTKNKLTAAAESNTSSNSLVLSLPQFLLQLGDAVSIDLFRLLAYLEESKLCRKLRDFRLRYQQQVAGVQQPHLLKTASGKENASHKPIAAVANNNNKVGGVPPRRRQNDPNAESLATASSSSTAAPFVSATPLYQLREFIEALTSRATDARIVIDRPKLLGNGTFVAGGGGDGGGGRLRFILLNPADKLRELVADCRALILLGGTMRPVDQLVDAFQRVCSVREQRILQFSCGHVIGPEQLVALSIGQGPDKQSLNLQFANREQAPVLRSLAQTLVNLIRHVPNGAVAFFPSYGFLGAFVQSIRASGHFAQLEKLKAIFVEARAGQHQPNANGDEDGIWTAYCAAARSTRGALLMAVVGGKLSEGINFSDELGRCVLMVGLPFPNRQSVELQERMRFVDQTMGPGAGTRLYEQLCLQSLNQAIGRAIRHRNDHAAIVLLDQRFASRPTSPMLENGLPGWIRQRLLHTQSFPQALTALIAFFRSHRQQPQLALT